MKQNVGNRALATLLSLVLLAGLMPTVAFATGTDTDKAIQLGTGGISGYSSAGYDYVYFGNWEAPDGHTTTGPVKWRVLDDQTNTGDDGLFLLSDALLGSGEYGGVYFQQAFHEYGDGDNLVYHRGSAPSDGDHAKCQMVNEWQGSDAQRWCDSFYANSLSSQEQSAALATTKSDGALADDSGTFSFAASESILSGDKVFFLSAEEAENGAYGFTDDAARIADYGDGAGAWWLRSSCAEVVGAVGTITDSGNTLVVYPNTPFAARPAFNLDLNTVLFTSAAEDGKLSNAAGADSLQSIADYSGSDWKLTLLDGSRSSFSADVDGQTNATAPAGGSVQIAYSGAQAGANEYVSVLLCDEDGNALYYGNIAQNSEGGTASVTIPSDLAPGSYTLSVFSEQCNGDYKTDYASDFVNIPLTVTDPTASTYTLTVDLKGGNGNTVGGEYAEGTVIHIDAGMKTNYSFAGWTSSNGGSFADDSRHTAFTMPAADTTITANWQYNGSTDKMLRVGAPQIEGGQASSVYFGNYQQRANGSGGYSVDPVKWRTLFNANGKLFLLADQNLDVQPYNSSETSITWEKSTIRSWLNGYGASENGYGTDYDSGNFVDTAFSGKEQGAIAQTHLDNADNSAYNTPGGNDTTDKVFLLSMEEASNSSYFPDGDSSRIATNNAYVAGNNTSMSGVGAEDWWWLRSPGEKDSTAADVTDEGLLNYGHSAAFTFVAVRPAFNLDLSSVLISSAAEGGKASGTVGADALRPIDDYSGCEWKMTLLDKSRGFSANATGLADISATAGGSVQIAYSGAQTGSNEYVSVLLCDSSGNALYYGRIAQSSASGTASVAIPSGLAAGSYTLKVFSEQCNDSYQTDYASAFQEIELNVVGASQEAAQNANDNGTTGSATPKTSDNGALALCTAVALAAGAILTVTALYSRQRRRNR